MAANSTPSQTPQWQANSIGPNKYGAPPNNGNRQALGQANSVSTQDYTGRNGNATNANPDNGAGNDLPSPLTLTSNATALIIPPNAISITMVSTATFSFSETGTAGSALTQYVAWPANTPVTLETARIKQLLVSGSAGLSFFFQTL